MGLSPNLVTLNVSSLNNTLNSSIIENVCFLALKLQAAFSVVLLRCLRLPALVAAGDNPGGSAEASAAVWSDPRSYKESWPAPVHYSSGIFFLFLQSPALERCQRMKKQLSKLGETALRYFFILNILLGGLFLW